MSIKRLLRPWVDRAAAVTGWLARNERRLQQGWTILMYHRVLPLPTCLSYPIPAVVMAEEAFRAQMEWVTRRFRVLPMRDIFERLEAGLDTRSEPLLSVSFDDGYYDNYTFVAPLLEELGVRGTFFIAPGVVGQGTTYWFDRAAVAWDENRVANNPALCSAASRPNGWSDCREWLEHLKDLPPTRREALLEQVGHGSRATLPELHRTMTMAQVVELARRGHEIGAHSMTHPVLTTLESQELRFEVHESKSRLEAALGHAVPGFCYPNGNSNEEVRRCLSDAGFDYACSVSAGVNNSPLNPLQLVRQDVTMARVARADGSNDLLAFRCEISGTREQFRR